MLIEHRGRRPVVPDSAYVAPTAVLCGAVTLGERARVLHGAVLTEVNRILDELDTEHRSRRLLEELDRTSREQRERMPRLTRLRESVRDSGRMRVPEVLRRNRGEGARRSR